MEEGIPDENLKRQEVSQVRGRYLKALLRGKKEGKKEGRKEGRKERRKEGRKEGKKEGKKEGRKKGRKERKERGKEREVAQSCLTLCDPLDYSPPGSSIHGIFQARVLEWDAVPLGESCG